MLIPTVLLRACRNRPLRLLERSAVALVDGENDEDERLRMVRVNLQPAFRLQSSYHGISSALQ